MGASDCPPVTSNSYIIIDGVFQINDLFLWTDGTPEVGGSETRSFLGDMHSYDLYQKEAFQINFPLLTLAQMYQLKQICRQIGVNAFHTVEYHTRGFTMKWDGVTAAGYTTNVDVMRVRKKVKFDPVSFPHVGGDANSYEVIISCSET